jgi:prepilin peptidase CpaA
MKAVILAALVAVLVTASITDIRRHRIPNWLTLPAVVAGLGLNASGAPGLLFGFEGLLLGLGLFMIPYLLGGIGAGDVKLLAAVGAMVGPRTVLIAALCATLVGGIYALALMAVHPRARATRAAVIVTLVRFFSSRSIRYDSPGRGETVPTLCYGVAIAAGSVLAVALEGTWPW